MRILSLAQLIKNQNESLQEYAVKDSNSKGRIHSEKQGEGAEQRTAFQIDRDRIMHCRAFRRMKGKTQVLTANTGDHYRTRITHSIEVAQISRDIARSLGLNEDLAESIALAHDLGHTPFGHAGQDALDECLKIYGPKFGLKEALCKFEHNEQSLRIVDYIENIYPDFRGLNLSYEVREGLMKHQTQWDNQGVNIIAKPCLEAQIVNLADEIAYNNHDIDDGLRAGLLTLDDLEKIELWAKARTIVEGNHGKSLSIRHLISRTVSALTSLMINDVIVASSQLLDKNNIKTLDDVYELHSPLISFSAEMEKMNAKLKMLLLTNFYFNSEVKKKSANGQRIIKKIFEYYAENENAFYERLKIEDETASSSMSNSEYITALKDFVAGMTDEYAKNELEKIES